MLGRLATLDPDTIGLSSYGPRSAFFPRQVRLFSKLSQSQASTLNPQTGKLIGGLPFFEESIMWYQEALPSDESRTGVRIVHGDFKIDNLVFHPTEPRVIGILDWELSTLGNPVCRLSTNSYCVC